MNTFIMNRQLVKKLCDENPTSYVYHPTMDIDFNFNFNGFRLSTTLSCSEKELILAKAAAKFQDLVIL